MSTRAAKPVDVFVLLPTQNCVQSQA
jgi:hypothetical protein